MPWRTESVMQQRVEFVIRARSGKKAMSELCREYGVSRPTGYLWLKRYEESGSLLGLQERSRRPHNSPGRTERALEELVLGLRDKTGWGASKLQEVLRNQQVELGRATVHRILVREGRVGAERRSLKKATKRFAREQCNELAQMDFKGEYQLPRKQKCYPLSLLDDCSRYLHGLWPLTSTGGAGVHRCLEGHFKQQGVPQAILMDHGTPWFSTQNQHGLTWVAVWLIKQGVVLKYSGIGHPQTQGKVERFHQTLKARTKHRGAPATMSEWLAWAEEFRREYNHERPHESLDMKTPAEVYRAENLRPYQEHPREWEYDGGTVKRLDGYGMLYYRGGSYFVCEALGHERVRIDQLDDKLVVMFRHLTIREIDLRTSRSIPVALKV
jgi:transposase InsO family protein